MDLRKVNENVQYLVSQNAPEQDIEAYLQTQGLDSASYSAAINEANNNPGNPGAARHAAGTSVMETLATLGSGAIAQPASGIAGLVASALPGVDAADVVDSVQNALTYQPRTEGGQQLTGLVAKPFEWLHSKADEAGQAVLDRTNMPALATIVSTALEASPMLLGAKGVKGLRGIKDVKPTATAPEIALLDKEGVSTTRAQRGSRGMKSMSRAADTIIGDSPHAEVQAGQFDQALLRRAGAEGDAMTPDVIQNFDNLVGENYNELVSRYDTKPDQALANQLDHIESELVDEGLDDSAHARVMKKIEQIRKYGGADIPGQAALNMRSSLGRMRASPDAGISHFAKRIQNALDNAFERSVSPGVAQLMKDTRKQYRMLKQFKEAMQSNPGNHVSPKKMFSVANKPKYQSAGLTDLARAGAQRLPDTIGNSGTAARVGDVGKILGAIQHPMETAKLIGAIGGGRLLNESPALGAKVKAVVGNPAVAAVSGEAALDDVAKRADDFLRALDEMDSRRRASY